MRARRFRVNALERPAGHATYAITPAVAASAASRANGPTEESRGFKLTGWEYRVPTSIGIAEDSILRTSAGLLAEQEMTAVLQLQDIARRLDVQTTVTPEQLQDLMKKRTFDG